MSKKKITLAEIAKKIGATVKGDEDCEVNSLATLLNAQPGQIAFLANKKYKQQLNDTNASAVIINEAFADLVPNNALIMDNPYLGYALTAQLLDTTPKPSSTIAPSAIIHATATLGNNVSIGANAVIEAGVVLSDHVSIGAGCFVGKNVTIGSHTSMWSNVSIYHEVNIGTHCLIQANTVIGSDGFGYAPTKGKWLKIPQLGTVIIGDHVEVGASTTIDRGALDDTIIENNVILDNQIQIAHNVIVGAGTAIAGCTVIAGSTTIGKNCTIAGLVGINGHINIVDNCMFTGMSMITKSIAKPGVYSSGMPVIANKDWNKMNARIRRLDRLSNRLSTLESEIFEKKK
jgi:UDP-3-O-[3-hydroxymyristoyl] glucosamine N-acyltransferase